MISKLKAVLDDDRGVSPVIGVILMVAITVILAAVIGTFVLGLGDSLEQAPQAQLDAESNSDGDLLVNHNGGDAIPAAEIRVTVDGSDYTVSEFTDLTDGDDFTVGGTLEVAGDGGGGDTLPDDTEVQVQVVHEPSESILLDTQVEFPA